MRHPEELRLGIDGDALRAPLSGVGQYVFHLCGALERLWPHAQLYAYTRLPRERLALPSSRWRVRSEPLPVLAKLPSFVWLKTRGAMLARADALDVFWAGRTLHPRLSGVRTVCTVHDLNHLLVPETMEWRTLLSHRLWWRADLARADAVLANSHGTAQRLREIQVPVADVVPPGVHARFGAQASGERADSLAALGIEPPYLLAVGTLEPRKNVRTLLHAYLALKRAGELPRHRLVLVGARGWNDRALERELLDARKETEGGVLVAGYVGDALLPALYAAADALVCPSLYEGFGMPVLEARACGTRVVVSDVPELREAGGPHAIVVEPTVDGVSDGIRRALRMPRVDDDTLATTHAWERSARRLALALRPSAAFEEVVPQ